MDNDIIGRNVLAVLGADNHFVVPVACKRLKGEIDIGKEQHTTKKGDIRSLPSQRLDGQSYHSSGNQMIMAQRIHCT